MVWNFGMGRPDFQTPRQDSQTVGSYTDDNWNQFQGDWQSRFNEEAARANAGAQREYLPTHQWMEGLNLRGGPWMPNSDMGKPQFQQGWRSEQFGPDDRPTFFGHDSQGVFMEIGQGQAYTPDFTALNAERAQRESEFAMARERQTRQQQAYNQQTGGGFAGGIIDDSYSAPFSGQITGTSNPFGSDPGMPGVTMPWAQPWGTPGFGGPSGGQSVGGYSPNPQQTQGFGSNQGSGWGGPFSNKNPWSLG